LGVDPTRGVGVSSNFEEFSEFATSNGATFLEQRLHLLEMERVALECGGVVDLAMPDPAPDPVGLRRFWETAHEEPHLGER
jgi:hypothetical protein